MSSSSDDDILLLENPFLKLRNKTIGIHPINRSRKSHGEYHHLFSELKADEERFFKYTRMTFATFNYILNKVENRLSKNWCNWHRQPIFPEERLVVTLRYLATGSSFKTLAFSFRMGASTVGNIVAETVAVLWKELYQLHMPAPTKEIFNSVAKDFFQVWNFPHVIGAIDGKHVRIQCPKNSGSMFYNYKKFYSVVLQAVADANYKFISVDIGGYGKQSDGGTFKASDIYHYLYNEQLDIPEPDNLPGTNVKAPFVLIGDEAYPLLTNLLKPFGGNNLTIEQQCFNKRLSRARKTVECAFGILYSKWRLLSKSIETDIALTDNIVKCMCVLHNTIIDKEGFERHLTEVFVFNEHRQDYRQAIGRSSNAAKSVRDVYATYFSNNPLRYNN